MKPNWPDACAGDVGAANLGLHGIVEAVSQVIYEFGLNLGDEFMSNWHVISNNSDTGAMNLG